MNTRIYRYRLAITDYPEIELPAGAEVLSVAPPRDYNSELDLWAVVDPGAPLMSRSFRVVGTGNPMPNDCGRFIGTVPIYDGRLIFHVFESGAVAVAS